MAPRAKCAKKQKFKGTKCQLAFPPTKGVCLFHGHGDECMTHEGAIVEAPSFALLLADLDTTIMVD